MLAIVLCSFRGKRKAIPVSNRDDFSAKTKQALALRAAYTCSFRGCPRTTSGPSEEAPDAVSMTGKAAHIHAAAPGGRRYLASMTPDERKGISNGIWLCSHHADLIDDDEVTYTADELRAMKREHEANRERHHREGVQKGQSVNELIAIGPDIIFCGELIGSDQSEWSFHLQDFVDGDLHALLNFIAGYDRTLPMHRYVLVNSLGDGRVMKGAPSVKKRQRGGYDVTFPVAPGAVRVRAADLRRSCSIRRARPHADSERRHRLGVRRGIAAAEDQDVPIEPKRRKSFPSRFRHAHSRVFCYWPTRPGSNNS